MQSNGVSVRLFSIDNIALVTCGIIGIYLSPKIGFPNLIDERISNRQRFGYPVGIGIAFALVDVALFKLIIHPEPLEELTPFMQPFPYSILLYISGALETEVMLRLLPIPVLMWLFGKIIVKNTNFSSLFWILAVGTSMIEPYLQLITDSIGLIIFSFLSGFLFNFIQVLFFRWYGFLASLFIRLGHYLIWHVAFGVFTEYF